MAAPVLQFKRGLLANLPGLRAGEPGFTTDSYDLYVGLTSETSTNKFFGSHRYWTKETTSTGSGVNLVEGTSNGSNYITLKSPDSLSSSGTYTLPATSGIVDGYYLQVASDGTLSWSDAGASGGSFTNSTLNGTTTVNGYLDATGADVNAGIVTVTDLYIDSTRVLYDDGSGITLAGIQTIDATTKNTLETILSLDPNDFDSLNVIGIATVGGIIDANGGLDVLGHSELDNVNVSGVITATNVVFGSGTAITQVDTDLSTVSGSHDTLASAKAIRDFVTTQVSGVGSSLSNLDLNFIGDSGTGAVNLSTQSFTIAGTANEIETSASSQTITVGLPDNVIIGAGLTVTGALDVNGGGTIDNVRIGVAADNEIDTSTGNLIIDSAGGTTTIDDELIVSGDVRINGNDIKASNGNTNITLTSNTLTTFAGDIKVTGNDIQASNGNVNITMTSNTLTEVKGDLKVTGNDIQSSTATALTLSGADVTVAGDLTVGGSDIKAADGTTALTLVNSTGAVTAANDLTVTGNLYVNGSTTQVNTTALTVEDRTIDLGIVNGAAPSSATTWDLGILFNYNSSGAKKSAVVWEHSDTRFKFASVLAADTNGTDVNTPQLTVTTFAPIEIGALWVTDCAGTSQVISCTGSERFLENITVDAGTF